MNIKHISAAIILAVGASFSASPANAIQLGIATEGSNVFAYSTMTECNADNFECVWLFSDCGGYDLYSKRSIGEYIYRVVNDGDTVRVHTVVNNRFEDYLCELSKN